MNSLLAIACEITMAMSMPLQNVEKSEGVLETKEKNGMVITCLPHSILYRFLFHIFSCCDYMVVVTYVNVSRLTSFAFSIGQVCETQGDLWKGYVMIDDECNEHLNV